MIRGTRTGLLLTCLLWAPIASAQRVPAEIQTKLDAIDKETSCFLSPGPGEGEQRATRKLQQRRDAVDAVALLASLEEHRADRLLHRRTALARAARRA